MPAHFKLVYYLSNTTVPSGGQVDASVGVQNDGDASGGVYVQLKDANNNVVAKSVTVQLDPGAQAFLTLSFKAPTSAGQYTYTYEVVNVSTGSVDATATLTVNVVNYVSSISNVVIKPTSVKPGDALHIEFDYNVSPAPTSDTGLNIGIGLYYPTPTGTGLATLVTEQTTLPANTSTLHKVYDVVIPDLGLATGQFTLTLNISACLLVANPCLATQYSTTITYGQPTSPAVLQLQNLIPVIGVVVALAVVGVLIGLLARGSE